MPTTWRMRQLARALQAMRTQAGMSHADVTGRTGIDRISLSRMENGHARPQKRTLLTLLELYGVEPARRDELLVLWADATKSGWWRPYSELDPEYATYLSAEEAARRVRTFEGLLVPGLLQTPEYARHVIAGLISDPTDDVIERKLQARVERQAVLNRDGDPLRVHAIVDEAALRRQVGGREVTRGQMAHLVEVAKRPTVTVQVVPFRVGAHAGVLGAFSIAEFPDDPPVVYVENRAGDLLLESAADIARYTVVFDSLRTVALSPSDSVGLLATLAEGEDR